MKSFLTQDMSMQNGSKTRPPNIIARLMGLDGLPPQSSFPSQPKSVENQHRRPITSEKAHGKNTYGDHEPFRRGSMDKQKFKDVFEVLDAEKAKSSRSLYQRGLNANLTAAKTDVKFHYSKEFNENLEALDSNKDLLLKFLHHPDSLFTERLPDLQSIAPKPHCSQASTLKLSNSLNRGDNFKTPKGVSHGSPQWHAGDASPSHSNTLVVPYEDTTNLSKKQLKKRNGLKPTEIVVLKPNLGKPHTTSGALPSHCSCDEVRADRRLPCTRNQESNAFGSLKANEDVNLLRKTPRDSRAIARIVSRQMKVSSGNDSSKNFEISRFRGYAGDESSSGSDSSSESKLVSVISSARTDFNRENHRRSRPFTLSESPMSKEAMRRLSERWKLAYKSEQEIEIRRRNTLAEMLETSDREASPASLYGINLQEGLTKRFESNVGQPELPEPIGISSRDGWKSTGKKKLSKDRTTMHQDRSCSYTIVLPKKLTTRDGLGKGSSFHSKDVFLSTSSTRVSSSSYFSENSSSEINRPNSSETLYVDGNLSEEKLLTLKTQSSLSAHADSDTEKDSDYEDAKSASFLEPLDLSAVTSLTEPDISSRQTEEVDSCSIPQPQPRESAKEGNQPSQVSILQTSFHDGFSSNPECFESLTADLQGLRMQLQLLKLESATTYNDGAMLVPSDEEAHKEESSIVTVELREDWKSLYLADVLEDSRFSDLNPESFMATWHSSESPIDPSLFKDLEKKYNVLKISTRLERKFLFDRINSEILEFFEQFRDLKPIKVSPTWDMNQIHKTLRELISVKYKKPSRDSKEKEFQWLNLEDDIEVFGKEIEEMLTDELITELVIGLTSIDFTNKFV